jgi:hypothetical protein
VKLTHETQQVITNRYEIEAQKLSEVMEVGVFDTTDEAKQLFAVGIHIHRTQTGLNASKHTGYWSAIVEKWVLDKILDKPEDHEAIVHHEIQHDAMPVFTMLSYQQLNDCRLYGRSPQLYQIDGKEYPQYNEENKKDMLKLVQTPNHEGHALCQFVRNPNLLHVWQTAQGVYSIQPFVMDYVEANLDNGTYHLDELTEHLSHLNHVAFIANESRYSSAGAVLLKCPLKGDEKHIDKIIDDIPGYNADEERNETLNLVYYPTQEDIVMLMNWKRDNKNHNQYNVERFLVQEILGGKHFLKHPEPEVENQTFKRKFRK